MTHLLPAGVELRLQLLSLLRPDDLQLQLLCLLLQRRILQPLHLKHNTTPQTDVWTHRSLNIRHIMKHRATPQSDVLSYRSSLLHHAIFKYVRNLAHLSSLLLLLLGDRRQALPQHPDRLLVSVETGAELGVVVAELQVPAAQIQNLLTVPGVLQEEESRTGQKSCS